MLDALPTLREALAKIILNEELPANSEFLTNLHNENGEFWEEESSLHDYKAEYPFSNSDSYFGGILRLICAFHNTYGGLIIFGVDDKTRLAGKNKVIVDPEKINRKLRESLTGEVNISARAYDTPSGKIDVVLVPRRSPNRPPVRFQKDIGGYSAKLIFRRKNAEVIEATGSDLEFLYGPRSIPAFEDEANTSAVKSALPASPATIGEFVGRFEVIEKCFGWLTVSKDPRLFLWGNGGSGKSTIAFEFATLVASFGAFIELRGGKRLDRVIYVSAKKQFLDPLSARIQPFSGTDFDNAKELYRAILELSHWTEKDLSDFSEDELLTEIEELFEIESQLVVIDDIDTLSVAGEDTGMEQLFGIIARCSSGTKILYTQRNLPSYAVKSSVEVPGLDPDQEFPQFVTICAAQFSVPMPNEKELGDIAKLSERRPLAIETIIGLRRITTSYEAAMQRWKSDASQAREYLFQREYDQLSRENRGRHLLAALAAFGKPQRVDVVQRVLNFSDEQLQDAIAETRDMFLRVVHDASGEGDLLSLGAATQSFVQSASRQLDRYEKINATVRVFMAESKVVPIALAGLLDRATGHIERGEPDAAVSLLSKDFGPAVTEHPAFKAVLASAYSVLKSPRYGEARALFKEAASLGHRDHRMFLNWLEMEKAAGAYTTNGIAVCELVVKSADATARTLATFYRKLAYLQVRRANELGAEAPDQSIELRENALLNNILALRFAKKSGMPTLDSFKEQVSNSFNFQTAYAIRSVTPDRFFQLMERILEDDSDVSDLLQNVSDAITSVSSKLTKSCGPQIKRHLSRISGRFSQKGFCPASNVEARQRFYQRLRDLVSALK